jgi:protein-L-isoaspartate(D-aspartate) O-methyltransferase
MRKKGGKLASEALRATLFVPMTGEAEDQRKVKPDPENPQIANGSFEEVDTDPQGTSQPTGWHYQRQVTLDVTSDAPDGTNFAIFRNAEPGRGSQALQGFAVDGRKVSALWLALWARGSDIQPGPARNLTPGAVITFYDERRAAVGEAALGQLIGSFEWREHATRIAVPLRAREAVLRIGLLGATGELALDHLRLAADAPSESRDVQR